MQQIILVEDDPNLNHLLTTQLAGLVDKIYSFYQLESAYQFLTKKTVDLAIIDRRFKDGDGLELVDYLHQLHYYTKTLILSQLNQTEEKIKGLSSGADDYLAKPFNMAELKLRVQNLLRKEKRTPFNYLSFGPLKLNYQNGSLVIQGRKVINLRKKESQILATLIRYQNQIITHRQIAEKVWPGENFYPTNTTINVYIRRLRLKLGEYKYLIKTARKFGYQLSLN